MPKLILCIMFSGLALEVFAEHLPVSTIQIQEQASYEIQRTYGGQLRHTRESQLGFETSGTVGRVLVDVGDVVKKGQLLLNLDPESSQAELDSALARTSTAKASLNAQKAQLMLANLTLKRNQALALDGHLSNQRLDELTQQQQINAANFVVAQSTLTSSIAGSQRARVKFNKTMIKAPYAGVILSRLVDEGSIVSPGAPVLTIVERSKIEALVGVPQNMEHLLASKASFRFLVNNRQVQGKLKAILPNIDPITGTVTGIFELDDNNLYGGSLAELSLSVTILESGFWIPLSSLAESQRGLWSVLVVVETVTGTTVEPRLVEVIHQGEDAVYVRGTLDDGDRVVDSGTGRIVPGQAVRIASHANAYSPSGR